MDELTALTISAIAASLSMLVAIASAVFAWLASRAAKRSADVAAAQLQLGHLERIEAREPQAVMELEAVSSRWSTGESVWGPGRATDPGVAPTDSVTRERAKDLDLHTEVMISGTLTNHSRTEMLVSVHSLDSREVRYPLQNQGLFLVEGEERRQTVIPAGGTLSFEWIDRRSLDEWLQHYAASDGSRGIDDLPVPVPSPRVWPTFRLWIRGDPSPQQTLMLRNHERVLRAGGFRVVMESRAVERIPIVWTAILRRSPIKASTRNERGELVWEVTPPTRGTVDDDVVQYRSAIDTAFAQLDPPRVTFVPGRH